MEFSSVFLTEYQVLTDKLRGIYMPLNYSVTKELSWYSTIKKKAEESGWNYLRLETAYSDGLPDILVTKGSRYWFIEVKVLKKPKLVSLMDDIKWQFGQLGFLKKCLKTQTPYLLLIAKDKEALALIGENYDIESIPEFIEQL